jgi:alkylation response protein AidB-like acyl-CoA dehydrogenase
MTFSFTMDEDLRDLRDLAESLAAEVVDPAAREAERQAAVPTVVQKILHASGLAVPVPEEQGGDGVPEPAARLAVAEALGHGDAAIAVSMLWQGLVPTIIGACGTSAQRDALLPRFATDSAHRGGLALYERFGAPPSQFGTSVELEPDGLRLRGQKQVVQAPSDGAPLLVIARHPERGLVGVVVDSADPALHLAPVTSHLGLDAVPTTTATFDLPIEQHHVLGTVDADDGELSRQVGTARLCLAAISVGAARRALQYAADYAQQRIAFNRPISAFQGVAFLVADGHMRMEAARLQLAQTIDLISTEPADAAEREVTHAVGYALNAAAEVTRDCVQVLGGHGFLTDHPVERWYRATAGLSTIDLDPSTQAYAPPL